MRGRKQEIVQKGGLGLDHGLFWCQSQEPGLPAKAVGSHGKCFYMGGPQSDLRPRWKQSEAGKPIQGQLQRMRPKPRRPELECGPRA